MARSPLSRRARPASVLAGLTLLSAFTMVVDGTPAAKAAAQAVPATPGTVRGDFNGDGFGDLAIGVPLEDIVAENQGAVEVIYGSADGLKPDGAHPDQLLVQNGPDGPEAFDAFGLALAVGDFNGDGYGDLAVGANAEDIGPDGNQNGAVSVFYGSARGLVVATAQYITASDPQPMDQFGFTLTAGDFDGDGRDDLAVDLLNRTVGTAASAGAVRILRGTAAGLDTNPANVVQLDQDQPGTENKAEPSDQFGSTLAAGDLNGDGRDDLAVGIPGEGVDGILGAGAVDVFWGCASGTNCRLVNTATDQYLTLAKSGGIAKPEPFDLYGWALAIGNFGRSGQKDLAVGISKTFNGLTSAGAVTVYYGTTGRLDVAKAQYFIQGAGGVKDTPEAGDGFGTALAAGDFGRGTEDDLAIGVPFEALNGKINVGAVEVLYGSPSGLSTAGDQFLTHGAKNGLPGVQTAGNGFGKVMAAANFGRSSRTDLAVASRDTVNGMLNAGAVTVLYGADTGLEPSTGQYLTQDSPGVEDQAELGDLVGGNFGQPGVAAG
jgi:FG-GAP repeat protein